jgi:hypothetical protein
MTFLLICLGYYSTNSKRGYVIYISWNLLPVSVLSLSLHYTYFPFYTLAAVCWNPKIFICEEALSLSVKVGNKGNLLLSRKMKGHLTVGYWSMFVIRQTCSYFFNNTVTKSFRNHQILSEWYKKIRNISQNIISTGHIFIKVFLYVSAYCVIHYRYKSVECVPYHFSEHGKNLVE